MSSSIIDFVNCHLEKENGDNKYINDKFLDVKEINSEDVYISKKLNLKGVVPADVFIGTDVNFNVIEKILPSPPPPSPYPVNPSCFGWYDSGSGAIPPNTIIVPNIIVPSFIQSGGFPQYNNPISASFVYNQTTGIITCNEAGIYLINQSFEIYSTPNRATENWIIGLYNRTSGRYYKGGSYDATPASPNPENTVIYNNTTYDTFTAGTQINIYGENPDPVNTIIFETSYLTFFRIA
jgi:hypothetical protein